MRVGGGVAAGLLAGYAVKKLLDPIGNKLDPVTYNDPWRLTSVQKRASLKTALHPAAWGAIAGTPIGAGAGYFLAPEGEDKLPYIGAGALGGGFLGTSLGGLAGLLGGQGAPKISPSSTSAASSQGIPDDGRIEFFKQVRPILERLLREEKLHPDHVNVVQGLLASAPS